MALQRGATRYRKPESDLEDLGGEPGRKDKVSLNLSFGSGYTEAWRGVTAVRSKG